MALAQFQERWRPGQSRPNAGRELRRARDAFAQAVAADPSLLEARLRLGRTLWRLGERDAARVELEGVAASAASASPASPTCAASSSRACTTTPGGARTPRAPIARRSRPIPADRRPPSGLAQLLGTGR